MYKKKSFYLTIVILFSLLIIIITGGKSFASSNNVNLDVSHIDINNLINKEDMIKDNKYEISLESLKCNDASLQIIYDKVASPTTGSSLPQTGISQFSGLFGILAVSIGAYLIIKSKKGKSIFLFFILSLGLSSSIGSISQASSKTLIDSITTTVDTSQQSFYKSPKIDGYVKVGHILTCKETEVTEPTESTEPTETTNPTEVTDPTDTTESTNVTEPTESILYNVRIKYVSDSGDGSINDEIDSNYITTLDPSKGIHSRSKGLISGLSYSHSKIYFGDTLMESYSFIDDSRLPLGSVILKDENIFNFLTPDIEITVVHFYKK